MRALLGFILVLLVSPFRSRSHLRRILAAHSRYYNETRTHLSLDKDAPLVRAVQRHGTIVAVPILSGAASLLRGYDFREGHPEARNAFRDAARVWRELAR